LDEILNYIEVKFGVVAAKKFIEKTDSILKAVSGQPYVYKASPSKAKIRKATINMQGSLFYEIKAKHIQLLYFWDNRRKPRS
jgi:plasmid stabilization system protein ParE